MTRDKNVPPCSFNLLLDRVKRSDGKLQLSDFEPVLDPIRSLEIKRSWNGSKEDDLKLLKVKCPTKIDQLRSVAHRSAPFCLAAVNLVIKTLPAAEIEFANVLSEIATACVDALEQLELVLVLQKLDIERLVCNLLTRLAEKSVYGAAWHVAKVLHRRILATTNKKSGTNLLLVPFVAKKASQELALLVVAYYSAVLRICTARGTSSDDGFECDYASWLGYLKQTDSAVCFKQLKEFRKLLKGASVSATASAANVLSIQKSVVSALAQLSLPLDQFADHLNVSSSFLAANQVSLWCSFILKSKFAADLLQSPRLYALLDTFPAEVVRQAVGCCLELKLTESAPSMLYKFAALSVIRDNLAFDAFSKLARDIYARYPLLLRQNWLAVMQASDELVVYLHNQRSVPAKVFVLEFVCKLLEAACAESSGDTLALRLALCKHFEMLCFAQCEAQNYSLVRPLVAKALTIFPLEHWKANGSLLERLVQRLIKSEFALGGNPFTESPEQRYASVTELLPDTINTELLLFIYRIEAPLVKQCSTASYICVLQRYADLFREARDENYFLSVMLELVEAEASESLVLEATQHVAEIVERSQNKNRAFALLGQLLLFSLHEQQLELCAIDKAVPDLVQLSLWYHSENKWAEHSQTLDRVFSIAALSLFGKGQVEACTRLVGCHLAVRTALLERQMYQTENECLRDALTADILLFETFLGQSFDQSATWKDRPAEMVRSQSMSWGRLFLEIARELVAPSKGALEAVTSSVSAFDSSCLGKAELGLLQGYAFLVYARCSFQRGDLNGAFVYADEALLRLGKAATALLRLLKTVETLTDDSDSLGTAMLRTPLRLVHGIMLAYAFLGQFSMHRGCGGESMYFFKQQQLLCSALGSMELISTKYCPVKQRILSALIADGRSDFRIDGFTSVCTADPRWVLWVELRSRLVCADRKLLDECAQEALRIYESVFELSSSASAFQALCALAVMRISACYVALGRVNDAEKWFASAGDYVSACTAPLRGEYFLLSAGVKLAKAAESLRRVPRLLDGCVNSPAKLRSSSAKRIEQAGMLLKTCSDAVYKFCTSEKVQTFALLEAQAAFLAGRSNCSSRIAQLLTAAKGRSMSREYSKLRIDEQIVAAKARLQAKKHFRSAAAHWPGSHPYTTDVVPFSSDLAGLDSLLQVASVVELTCDKDANVLYVTRYDSCFDSANPIVVQLPLCRCDGAEESLSIRGAFDELELILQSSYKTTHSVKETSNLTTAQKQRWWEERQYLDRRLARLVLQVEKQWIGGFGGLFSASVVDEIPSDFSARLEQWIVRTMSLAEQKQHVELPSAKVAYLVANCSREKDSLEDMARYLTGVSGSGELLGEFLRKVPSIDASQKPVVLVLDKHLHAFPWESLPCLQERAVSRCFSVESLLWKWSLYSASAPPLSRANVGYVLNPDGDLRSTEECFSKKLQEFRGIVGRQPSSDEMKGLLCGKTIFLYFGHGSGEQYLPGQQIRQLSRCAAVVMLMGCSSGKLKLNGEFEPNGTLYNYALSSCLSTVANLWDVTDKDLDRFSDAVLTKWGLFSGSSDRSLSEAVCEARSSCKLTYLVGASPVLYGLPLHFTPTLSKFPVVAASTSEDAVDFFTAPSLKGSLSEELSESLDLIMC